MKKDKKAQMPELGQSQKDDLALVVRAAASVVPVFGGLLGEVFTEIASDRQERLEEYVRRLFERLEALQLDVNRLLETANRNMFEAGARASVEQTNFERIANIASCVAIGVSDDARKKPLRARLIEIVSQLDLEEIQILDSLRRGLWPHPKGMDPTVREIATAKLERLNLIRFWPSKTEAKLPQPVGHRQETIEIPEYDHQGFPSGRYQVTQLGDMVLDSVTHGLADQND